MTALVEQVGTDLIPGLTFALNGGVGVLVCPAPDTAPEARLWAVWTPSSGQLEELVIGEMTWVEPTPLGEIVNALANAWASDKRQHRHTEVLLARSEQLVEDIREYAVERHLEGAYCRDGLNKALEHFDLEPYQPRFSFEVVVRAKIDIDADDPGAAERRLRYLIDGLAISGEDDDEDLEVELQGIETHLAS